MTSGSRIGIVGAGVAGLACAKVLSQAGFPVEVFDRAPDVGGVWSATRRYPGLRAQNSKATYAFSDHPMPEDFPRWPDGQQMQAYLAGYVQEFGLGPHLRLGTEVVAADPVDSGWLLEIRDQMGGHRTTCDHLIVANGVYSDPVLPDLPGAAAFRAAGGRLCHVSEFHDVEQARDRSVVVLGYGKSACDVAEAVSHIADETTVVARRLTWKMPRKLGFGADYERLLLTRAGEAHFPSRFPHRAERLLDRLALRQANMDLLQERVTRKLRLRELDLVPTGPISEIGTSSASLATEGFTEQIEAGRIGVHRDTEITELIGGRHGPAVRLADGSLKLAEIVVCATGYRQEVPFLTPFVRRALTDETSDFRLYRHILPVEIPNLSFAGYNSSHVSALSAEVGAHWIAGLLTGRFVPPMAELMNNDIDARLEWSRERSDGNHAHGASVVPFSLANIDEMLDDLGTPLPLMSRLAQWVRPVRPSSYREVLRTRAVAAPAAPTPAPVAER
ncbi:flavin-containing monooxygenase [Nocardia salmonicida]|uniref:flavin-containing monooxygenase n=1 Tax=Nocardia salmonicida TaxID=53431 RepID=UPI0007C7587F|nr:NAD(P)/FAD-dependent oxidoreductase [Nocardia salmonicida]